MVRTNEGNVPSATFAVGLSVMMTVSGNSSIVSSKTLIEITPLVELVGKVIEPLLISKSSLPADPVTVNGTISVVVLGLVSDTATLMTLFASTVF